MSCTHCKQTCHVVDKGWVKNPHLKPKGLQRKESRKAALVAQTPKGVHGLTEPNSKLSLMTGAKERPSKDDLREQLFTVNMQVKTTLVDVVIDLGSQKNLLSNSLVQKLGLKTNKHPKRCPLGWLQKEGGLQVSQQCTFKFALDES